MPLKIHLTKSSFVLALEILFYFSSPLFPMINVSLSSCLGRNSFAGQGRLRLTEQYVKCCKDSVVNPSFTKKTIASSSALRKQAWDKSSPALLPC